MKKGLLEGKYAIVTGGGSGIGAGDVRRFAEEGAAGIVIPDIALENAQKVADEVMESYQCKCIAVKTDVSKEADVNHVFDVVKQEFGRLDILVNNAGITNQIPFLDLSADQWDRTMGINLKSAFMFSQRALRMMKEQKYGRIVNMGSIAGQVGGLTSGADYACSKAGLICLTKSVAKQGANFNVTCNSVAPGQIQTPMADQLDFRPDRIPMQRVGDPQEVSDVIVFLASDLSRYVTGACVNVNGGMNMN